MEKFALFVIAALALISACAYAQIASVPYQQGDLLITRSLNSISEGMISYTTSTAVYAVTSEISIRVNNTGELEMPNATLVEDLTYLPPNAKIEFLQAPSQIDGSSLYENIGR